MRAPGGARAVVHDRGFRKVRARPGSVLQEAFRTRNRRGDSAFAAWIGPRAAKNRDRMSQ
jgi:hypothetical protein